MSSPKNFRSAFNGFNREDVVHYIEYLNSKLTSEISQLQSDAEFLRDKLKNASDNTELQEQLAAAEAARDELSSQLEAVQLRNRELEQRCADLEAQLQSARQKTVSSPMEQELEAYRRAERMERVARERAEQVYQQANGALADATVRVDEASAQISQMTDKVSAQLEQLQSAVAGSKKALADAAATLYTIRPGSTQD
ncbi:MAG: hypothetical protein IJN67_08095 [Oscillospiraceae bacterium]|nr:hypothetical protein [Oscillospiraceae bacterium]